MANEIETQADPLVQSVTDTQGGDIAAIEDIISGGDLDKDVTDAFGLPEISLDSEAQQGSPETAPVNSREAAPQAHAQPENEQVRFQYWQSEADKRQNELDTVKKTNEILTNQLSSLVGNVQPVQPQQPQEEAKTEEFPPPPDKPQRPHGYNREEAYSDPSSESARHLDEVESWRDDMDEYNRLAVEYNTAVVQSEREQYNEARRRDDIRRQEAAQQEADMNSLKSHIQGTYSADENTFNDFVQKMSDPASLNPDNLWRLYQMDRGQTVSPPAPAAPSATFQQTRRAQSVPSPMGVMPSQNVQVSERSAEDKLMDSIIEDQNRLNII
tara:strand:- start:445 stop:1425 length:981 start_codon:yes stop_codon:yes gene_type:complete